MAHKIEIGMKFGNLEVVSFAGKGKQGHYLWDCLCGCGNTVTLRASHLDGNREHCSHQCELLRLKRLNVKIGEKYNRWTVLSDSGNDKNGNATFECQCDCGTIKPNVLGFALVSGGSKSCGCLVVEVNTRHGQSKTKEYRAEIRQRYRLRNPEKDKENRKRNSLLWATRHPEKVRALKRKLSKLEYLTKKWQVKERNKRHTENIRQRLRPERFSI